MLPESLKHMDKNGFLPKGLRCKTCNKELSGENGPRPAETYAGTFTGECYSCQNAGPFTVEEHFDGAITMSYPPHCPSFRRDRETYTGYPDCPECGGSGRKYISRCDSKGGSYYSYCDPCFKRYYEQPLRKKYGELHRMLDAHISEKWNKKFRQALKEARIDPERPSDCLTEEEQKHAAQIASPLLKAMKKEKSESLQRIQELYERAKKMKDSEGITQLIELYENLRR